MEKEQTRGRGVPRRRGERGNKLKEREGIIPQGQGTSGSPEGKEGGLQGEIRETTEGRGRDRSPKGYEGDPQGKGKGRGIPQKKRKDKEG